MKLFLSLLLMLNTSLAFAAYPTLPNIRYELNNSPFGQHVQLGTQLVDKKPQILRAQWSQTASGSTTGSISLLDMDGKAAVLPANSVITHCYIDVRTAITLNSTANNIPTFSFASGLNGTDDLKAAAQGSTYTTASAIACIPTGSAATAIKITTASTPVIRITSASYATYSSTTPSVATAGKINVLIEYMLSE